MAEMAEIVEKLCKSSVKDFINPYTQLQWPRDMEKEQWFMSPELISIYGTDVYDSLSDRERMLLSFHETVNFFSLNIHGEKSLVEGLARRLYRKESTELSPYLHHFLDEENKHMVYFGGFCSRYAGKVYPDRKLSFPRQYESGEESFLFFAKVLIFEEIVDVYNVRMSLDARLVPLARQINLLHHRDEARHLVFGRQLVQELFERHAPRWSAETLAGARGYLESYLVSAWKEYYNPDVYSDTGLANGYQIQAAALNHPRCREHRRQVSAGCLRYLLSTGILEKEPQL